MLFFYKGSYELIEEFREVIINSRRKNSDVKICKWDIILAENENELDVFKCLECFVRNKF